MEHGRAQQQAVLARGHGQLRLPCRPRGTRGTAAVAFRVRGDSAPAHNQEGAGSAFTRGHFLLERRVRSRSRQQLPRQNSNPQEALGCQL